MYDTREHEFLKASIAAVKERSEENFKGAWYKYICN